MYKISVKDNYSEIEFNMKIQYYDTLFFTILKVEPFCLMHTVLKDFFSTFFFVRFPKQFIFSSHFQSWGELSELPGKYPGSSLRLCKAKFPGEFV